MWRLVGGSVRSAVAPRFGLWQHGRYQSQSSDETPAIEKDVAAAIVNIQKVLTTTPSDEGLPLASLISKLTPKSRQIIFKQGKGLEGFCTSFPQYINVVNQDGSKRLFLGDTVDPSLNTGVSYGPTTVVTRTRSAKSTASHTVMESLRLSSQLAPDEPTFERTNFGDEEKALLLRIWRVILNRPDSEPRYMNLNTAFNAAARCSYQVSCFGSFAALSAAVSQAGPFWLSGIFVARKLDGEIHPPPLDTAEIPKPPRKGVAVGTNAPAAAAGAANPNQATSSEDIYEVLKYVPLQWARYQDLNIPQQVRVQHIRSASVKSWFERQPRFFDVRHNAHDGTVFLRRSKHLHPDEIGDDEPVGYVPPGSEPTPAAAAPAPEPAAPSPSLDALSQKIMEETVKALDRVATPYFIPIEHMATLVNSRRPNVSAVKSAAEYKPDLVETVEVANDILLRKRVGVDSSKWLDNFVADIGAPEGDLKQLIPLMTRSCGTWDRPEYLYVRLPDSVKSSVGGYEGMVELMRRHPAVFRFGEEYYRRATPSDPSSEKEDEPREGAFPASLCLPDNPYINTNALLQVFSYVLPEGDPVGVVYFTEHCSPAMKSALPPRLLPLLAGAEDLFKLVEVSPGVTAVQKPSPK